MSKQKHEQTRFIPSAFHPSRTQPYADMTHRESTAKIFADPARASRNLRTVHEAFIKSGSQYAVEEFSAALEKHLGDSPDPDMVLNNFLRFTEATVSKAALFNDLIHYPVQMEMLLKISGHSQYFADILVRDPELFRWITTSDSLVEPRMRDVLAMEVARVEQMFQKPERKLDGLRRMYRREILRIGVRDILGEADLSTTTGELSNLADVLIDASCRIAEQQLREKYPVMPGTPYAVIGLGKLGGGELNYSSDIDILFVYGEEGELKTGRTMTYLEYFNKLVEKIVQNLSNASAEGHLYRVDTRLRPESGAGPLARSLSSFLTYYESRGELWERQMLIKARPVAGDIEFGKKFLKQLEPFVYPRTWFQHPAESIARIKARIEATVQDEDNVKLRAGGIRDIEFIAQSLQLLNGGKNPGIRESNTLHALQRLGNEGLLNEQETATLSEAYVFLRQLEHKLQTMLNTQTHAFPRDKTTQLTLARRLGFSSAQELHHRYNTCLASVRGIFDAVFVVKPSPSEVGIERIIDGGITGDVAAFILARYGCKELQRSTKNLSVLLTGSTLSGVRELDVPSREAFQEIAPALFNTIAQSPDPDFTLNNLTAIVSAQRMPGHLYGQLGNPGFRKMLLDVCSISSRFARGVAADPALLESLVSEVQSYVPHRKSTLSKTEKLIEFKNREDMRIGIRHILGLETFDEMTAALTDVADSVVRTVLQDELKKSKLKVAPLAILALGKYGTREITFDSDLDVIFISGSVPVATRDKLEKVAAFVVQRLSAVSARGRMYEVDARLRPEGKSSPLVVEHTAHMKYLRQRASLWERQSLTRLRFVCGDKALARRLVDDVNAYVYESLLPPDWVERIVSMRRKIETRSRTRSGDFQDIKLGAGGMVDVEFLSQMLQLKYGGTDPAWRELRAVEVLQHANGVVIDPDDSARFIEGYRFLRSLEKFIRITLDERGTIMPEGNKLELLARCLNGSAGEALHDRVATTMRDIRARFLSVANSISPH